MWILKPIKFPTTGVTLPVGTLSKVLRVRLVTLSSQLLTHPSYLQCEIDRDKKVVARQLLAVGKPISFVSCGTSFVFIIRRAEPSAVAY